MAVKRPIRLLAAGGAALALAATGFVHAMPAFAAYEYHEIDRGQMQAVWADSVETSGEGANGPIALILDGNADTYWHTKWSGAKDPMPHSFIVKLAENAVENVGRVVLKPRQSSNGSGRAHGYTIATADSATCDQNTEFTERAKGEIPETVGLADSTIDFDPVRASCLKVTYTSAWGGAAGTTEDVASLAEFKAFTRTGEADTEDGASARTEKLGPRTVEGALELANAQLQVRFDPAFPQVIDYRVCDDVVLGSLRDPLTQILIDEQPQDVTVGTPKKTDTALTYPLTLPGIGASMDAVFTIKGTSLTFTLTNIKDPQKAIHRIRIPNQDIVTLDSAVPGSQISAMVNSVSREQSGDRFEPIAIQKNEVPEALAKRILANTDKVAIAFSGNGVEDNTGPQSTRNRVNADSSRWARGYRDVDGGMVGSIWSGTWVHRGSTADLGIGPDPDPYWTIKFTGDANADGAVDWQDGAIAYRDIRPDNHGKDRVASKVITHIPFNIVSQATHPFLRTLDDVKRISLATDGLGQQVLLKGYEAEGHDSAHPDYADHYNVRAGGLKDLTTLANEGDRFNASFGVHVNTTESYSESKNFSEELLNMPPQKAWGWMNQSYYINGPKDLGTGNVLKRFADFKKEVPKNLDWLYIDVYYPDGWQSQRLGHELQKQGWVVGSEWSDKFDDISIWSHWSQDEPYGGRTNKGWNSKIFRFEENTYRDQFNPDPILSNSNVKEFEGWAGNNNYNAFIRNVWERNLPTKFLQQSPIMKWEDHQITFRNGTVATSELDSIDGTTIPTNREITYDGAKVYAKGGAYLLPWKDGGLATNSKDGCNRLYHYNPAGGSTTWTLTDAWKTQKSLTLFKLNDTGRHKVKDIPVVNGQVTLEGIDANTAYVLYPTSDVLTAKDPKWGWGTPFEDPGFFSNTLDHYRVSGDVQIEVSNRGNAQALLPAGGQASLAKTIALPKGTYSAWAWVEIEPGKTRPVAVSVIGENVTPAGGQKAIDHGVATTIVASTTPNKTGSDEKYGTSFQRLRVTFTTDGKPVRFAVSAGEGQAAVRVDDLRVVPWKAPQAPADSDGAKTLYYQDFENVDTGYWPFVTGSANGSGDARTQLAERHEPYSQKGWWGVQGDRVVEHGKLIDNVLDGQWSLMAHEESSGQILKTAPGSLPDFQPGHKYRISFDYQSAYANKYSVNLGDDQVVNGRIVTRTLNTFNVPQKHETAKYAVEFVPTAGTIPFVEVIKTGGGAQSDMTIDNFRVEDLGETEEAPTSEADPVVALKNPIGHEMLSIARDLTENCTLSEELTGERKPNGPADAAIDGNPDTFWHTKWSSGSDNFPHCLTLKLADGHEWTVTGLEYTARQDGQNSRAKGYQIKVSADGQEWKDVAEGNFASNTKPQAINFADDKVFAAKYVRLIETSSQAGNRFGGAAEIRIGALDNGQPVGTETEEPDAPAVVAGPIDGAANLADLTANPTPDWHGVTDGDPGATSCPGDDIVLPTGPTGEGATVTCPADPDENGSEKDPTTPGGDTDPVKPGETDEVKPGETDPVKPGDQTVKPGETDPVKPGDQTVKPGETDPVKPGDQTVKPGETDPVKPGDQTVKPGQKAPVATSTKALARTGTAAAALAAGGAVLILGGGVLIEMRRRRS